MAATSAETADAELSELRRLLKVESEVLAGSWSVTGSDVHWSPENHLIFGTDPETFTPTRENVIALHHPDDRDRVVALSRARLLDAKPFAAVYRIVRPSGEVRVCEVRGWMQQDRDGVATGSYGTTTDVTDVLAGRRERDALSEQRDVILRTAGDAICGIDRAGRITFSNPALWELLGRRESEVDGARLHDLAHRDGTGGERHGYAHCGYAYQDVGPGRETDSDFRCADGTIRDVSYMRASVVSEHFDGVVFSLRDVTERLETARRLSASLEQVRSLSAQRGALLRNVAAAEENERSRIAADLHDDTVQTLGAVSLRLGSAVAAAQDPSTVVLLERAEADVRAATTRMRFLLFELLPPVSEQNLRMAIEAYCELLFSEAGIAYAVSGDPRDVPIDCYLPAYRLIQGALRNVLKHARASRVQISVAADGTHLTARIGDDGVGYDPGVLGSGMSAGLSMVCRVQAAGGSADIGTDTDMGGASIELRLPLRSDVGQG